MNVIKFFISEFSVLSDCLFRMRGQQVKFRAVIAAVLYAGSLFFSSTITAQDLQTVLSELAETQQEEEIELILDTISNADEFAMQTYFLGVNYFSENKEKAKKYFTLSSQSNSSSNSSIWNNHLNSTSTC